MPDVATTDAIFMCKLQEKLQTKSKNLYLAFADLEKAFGSVYMKVIPWSMGVVGILYHTK